MQIPYILISLISLAVIAGVMVYRNRKNMKRLSKLGTFAFLLVLLGIFFGENRAIGYSLMSIGVILCFVDIAKGMKEHK